MIGDLELLAGMPIDIGVCKVHPLTLGEIVTLGEINYNYYMSSLMFDKSNLDLSTANREEIETINQMSSYDILGVRCITDDNLRQVLLNAFTTFLKEDVYFHEAGVFYIGDLSKERIILPEHFEQIKAFIQKQNFIEPVKKKEFKAADDNTAKIMEKLRKAKEKIQQQQKDDGLSLSDIISIVSVYSNTIGILDVWKLTIYQLYMYYMRIIMWDDYHNNFTLLPHVGDQKDLNLKHWSTKLNNLTNNQGGK